MSNVWTEAEYIPANSPEGREIQLRHLDGFTAHRLAEARQRREKAWAAQTADANLAQAIVQPLVHGSPAEALFSAAGKRPRTADDQVSPQAAKTRRTRGI